jgi:uncharacterized GH25 family protein
LRIRVARATFGAAAGLLLLTAQAGAHDFWIEPSTFRPAAGEDFTVSLRVGEHFRGEPVPRDDRRIRRFHLVSAGGEAPVPGIPASDPAGFARIDASGVSVIGYRSDRSPVTLEAEKFEKYLADEGLDAVLKERARRGEQGKPGREVFSRSVKSIVVVGPRGREFDRRAGLEFEVLLESDPALWKTGAPMAFRLLYDGKPFAGALVKAICRDDPDNTLTVRSGKNGALSFPFPRKGVWLVEAVRMTPAPPGVDADWESIWASLTFEIP